ncbi:MAG: IMPACT family protein [Campylobacteraceae bacterium]
MKDFDKLLPMQIVSQTYKTEYEIKKSIFLSYLVPFSEFEALHVTLKKEHPKAVHVVWAYRFLNEFNQIVENSSDDGEPKGTSGPPILNVMRGLELVNVGILVVRYFGGIKLGTGGLVRAYGTSAKMVLEIAGLEKYEHKEKFSFTCKYSFVGKIEHFLTKEGVLFDSREFQSADVVWNLFVTLKQKEEILEFLNDLINTSNAKVLA